MRLSALSFLSQRHRTFLALKNVGCYDLEMGGRLRSLTQVYKRYQKRAPVRPVGVAVSRSIFSSLSPTQADRSLCPLGTMSATSKRLKTFDKVVEDAEPASIDILAAVPPDVAGEILRYLSGIEEHNNLNLVSRTWGAIVRCRTVSLDISLDGSDRFTGTALQRIFHHYLSIRELCISQPYFPPELLLRYSETLRSLTLKDTNADFFLEAKDVLVKLTRLEYLEAPFLVITTTLPTQLRQLRVFGLPDAHAVTKLASLTQLERLELTSPVTQQLYFPGVENLTKLESVSATFLPRLEDGEVDKSIIEKFTRLRRIIFDFPKGDNGIYYVKELLAARNAPLSSRWRQILLNSRIYIQRGISHPWEYWAFSSPYSAQTLLKDLVAGGHDMIQFPEVLSYALSALPFYKLGGAKQIPHESAASTVLRIFKERKVGWYVDIPRKGVTPLQQAAKDCDSILVQKMLDLGAAIDFSPDGSSTPLMRCVQRSFSVSQTSLRLRQINTLKVLLGAGANTNISDSCGSSALMLAHSDQDIIRLLLDHGADVHHSSSTGTVAHVAAFTGWNSAAIEMLIDAGLDVNKKGAHGITPLMEASSSRYLHVVQQLLELEDININDVDDEGRSALFYAATSNNEETMQALLGAGINPNIQANNGDTAFHCVCSRLRIVSDKTLKYFAVAGADITLKNGVGKRALTAESIEGLDKKECRSLLKIFPQAAKYLVL